MARIHFRDWMPKDVLAVIDNAFAALPGDARSMPLLLPVTHKCGHASVVDVWDTSSKQAESLYRVIRGICRTCAQQAVAKAEREQQERGQLDTIRSRFYCLDGPLQIIKWRVDVNGDSLVEATEEEVGDPLGRVETFKRLTGWYLQHLSESVPGWAVTPVLEPVRAKMQRECDRLVRRAIAEGYNPGAQAPGSWRRLEK
jgi:hypothetical protein